MSDMFAYANDFHNRAVADLRQRLERHFRGVGNVYVSSGLPFCYEQGRPVCPIPPDVLVAKGVGKHPRYRYSLRDEKKPPDVLFEVVSAETWREDLYLKTRLFAMIGITEYFLFDTEAQFLRPPLLGFRRVGIEFKPIPVQGGGSLESKMLNLVLRHEQGILRVTDPKTNAPIASLWEEIDRLRKEIDKLRVGNWGLRRRF